METELYNKKFWKDKRVFITGSTGLLGSWVTQFLNEAGAIVICLIRDRVKDSNFYTLGLQNKTYVVYGDLKDFDLINRTINEYEIDTVFHIGAQTIVGTANRNPIPTLKTNLNGTVNVLEACRLNPTVERILVASSDKAYGTNEKLPYDEDTPLKGQFPYDVSKSCADLLAQMYFNTYKLPVCITRCGNIYGPGDLNFNRIVPGILRDIYEKRRPVIRSDGKFVRNYFYVKDAAGAYITLAEQMVEKNLFGQAFNFSTDEKYSVLEFVNKLLQVMGSGLQPDIRNEAKNEIKSQFLSSVKARTVLGWTPKYNLDIGLEETKNWYLNHFTSRNGKLSK